MQSSKRSRSDSSYSEELEEPIAFLDSLPDDFVSFGTSTQNLEMNAVSVVPDDTFTVTQAVNAFGFGKFQAKLSLFTGLCWMADSMEMTILSILGPALHCEWHITRYQQALATTVVFLGMMLSSTFWSYVSDKYGRKQNHVFLTATLFLARGIIAGVFQAAYVYTPEVYPAGLRSVGVGTCSAMARFGAMLTPYIAQVLLQYSLVYAISVYTIISLLAALACSFLPIETKEYKPKETGTQ